MEKSQRRILMPLCSCEPYIPRGEWCGRPGKTVEVVWATK